MRRAILVALGTMTLVSSAAAIRFSATGAAEEHARVADFPAAHVSIASARESARASQREGIELRYQAERARCAPLGGALRDRCLIAAHALKGRALLEAAAPYRTGS